MIIGYARVSTDEQRSLPEQRRELRTAGASRIFTDVASGASAERPGLVRCLKRAGDGDTLVVVRLDRLGRSLRHLLQVVEDLDAAGVAFRSLRDGIDTRSASGRLQFAVLGAMAEFERELVRERTQSGLRAARARGRVGGRPPALDARGRLRARQLYRGGASQREVAETLSVSVNTVRRALREHD